MASAADLTLAPPGPAETDTRVLTAMSTTDHLVELPFFTSMPDTSADRRFSDTRKSAFINRVHDREFYIKYHKPPPVTWSRTIPDPTFRFRDAGAGEKVLMGPETALTHPFVPGRGARPPSLGVGRGAGKCSNGDSEIFPRFDFDVSSTALSSSAYGRWLPGVDTRHKPCAPFADRGKSLSTLYDEQAARVEQERKAFADLQRATEAAARRCATTKNLKARHGMSSRQIRSVMEMFD